MKRLVLLTFLPCLIFYIFGFFSGVYQTIERLSVTYDIPAQKLMDDGMNYWRKMKNDG